MDTLGQAKEELLEAGYDLISPAQKEARKKYKPIARDGRHFAMQNIEGYELLRSQLTQGQKVYYYYLQLRWKSTREESYSRERMNA